jgi:hypothetical protein
MPNVVFVHPDVRKLLPSYELIRDCLDGETQVKFRRTKYLPKPNPDDESAENNARYNAYITRAVFYNVSQLTQAGLVGQVFLRDPVAKVPSTLDTLVSDATGSGVPLDQEAQRATGYVVAFGRAGLYVDFPATNLVAGPQNAVATAGAVEGTENAVTLADIEGGEVRPTLRVIPPWDIINYRVKRRGAKIVLSLVVFREDAIIDDDGFETRKMDQWRALRLDETDQYVIEVYRTRAGNKPDEIYYPTDAAGNRIRDLGFSFIGAFNNEPKPGHMPMYDLCSINMAHYRNSADYEEAVYQLGQPTAWFGGLTEQWVKEVLQGTIRLGSRSAIPLPVGATAGLLQVTPNTLAKEAMDQKEAQMIALGAKLVEASQVQRTATEADNDQISETSILSSTASNVGSAFTWGLQFASQFVGTLDASIEYDLNTEFDLVNLTPDERRQLIAEWQSGAITFEEMRDNLRRGGIATLSDNEAKTKIAAEGAERLANEVAAASAMTDATGGPPNAPPGS